MKIKTLFNYKILFFILILFLIVCIKPSDSFAKSVNNVKITLSYYNATYNGSAFKPSVTVKYGSKTLKNGKDYTVLYSNNVNPGTAKVKVRSKIPWVFEKTISFSISKASICYTNISLSSYSYTYRGSAIKPNVTVKYGSKTLKNGKDYTVSYSNNINAGTAKVNIKGKGNFVGMATKTFSIKKDVKNTNISISKNDKNRKYEGRSIEPKVTVKYGNQTLRKR